MKKNPYGIFLKVSSFNFLIFGLILYFSYKGWLYFVFSQDESYISFLISSVTLLTIFYLNFVSYKINILQDLLHRGKIKDFEERIFKDLLDKNMNSDNLYMILFSKIYFSKQISMICTLLGLLGTVLGFIFVLIYVDFSLLKDAQNIQSVLNSIATGMGIALYTTLVGTFCSLWIYVLFILMNFDINKLCFKYSLIKNGIDNIKDSSDIVKT